MSSNGTETYAKPISAVVAPLQFCPATSQPESTQYQGRALRVASQALTPGPLLSGIRAESQMCTGGISFISQTETSGALESGYTVGTAGSIKEQVGAASEMGALVPFAAKSKNEKTIPDATNYRFLTTGNPGYSSGFTDEFSLISDIAKSGERRKLITSGIPETLLSGAACFGLRYILSISVTVSGFLASSQRPSGGKNYHFVRHAYSSSVRLAGKRPAQWLRGPPTIHTA